MTIVGPDRHRDDDAVRRLVQFLAIAVLVHLAAIPLLSGLVPEAPPKTETRPVKLVNLTPRQLQQLKQRQRRAAEERAKKRAEKKEEERDKEEKLDGQVVDLPPSPDDTPPEEYDYLSEHNTNTERESVSRHREKDYRNALNEVGRAADAKAASPKAEQRATAIEIGEQKNQDVNEQKLPGREKVFELPTIEQRDRLALQLDPEFGLMPNQRHTEPLRGNSRRLKLSLGQDETQPQKRSSAPEQGPPTVDLIPTIGVMAQISGAPANDHLEDVEEGEGTFLNSREFKYASFFNRMKRGVSQQWRPIPEYRRRDPTGHVYGKKSRVTVLRVVLTAEGGLKDVEVARSSGLDFLDNEAISAFRRAEPFPNPPKGLVDNGTELIDFPFAFHIEFNRRGFKLPF